MAAPVRVQQGATATNSVNVASRVYASNITAGNYSVVFAWASGVEIGNSAVVDSRANTYTFRAKSNSGGNSHAAIWTAPIGSTGACTVTVTLPGGTARDQVVAAIEVSVTGGTTLGVETSAGGVGATAAPTSGSLVTTLDTLLLAITNFNTFNTCTPAAGWTQIATTGFPQQSSSLTTRTSAAGTYTASWTNSESIAWQVVAIALKEAAGAPAAVETVQPLVWMPV